MTYKSTLDQIWSTSRRIKDGREKYDVLAKGMEELGELSQEIMISLGRHYKPAGKDGVIGEAVDVIVCMADIIYQENPNITADEVHEILAAKLSKWEDKSREQQPNSISDPIMAIVQTTPPVSVKTKVKIPDIQIPFDADGKLLFKAPVHPSWNKHPAPFIDWQQNRIFHATITYLGVSKGIYSDRYAFRDQNKNHFTMVAADFDKMVPFMVRGVVEGEFHFSRRNEKYGITFVRELPIGQA